MLSDSFRFNYEKHENELVLRRLRCVPEISDLIEEPTTKDIGLVNHIHRDSPRCHVGLSAESKPGVSVFSRNFPILDVSDTLFSNSLVFRVQEIGKSQIFSEIHPTLTRSISELKRS